MGAQVADKHDDEIPPMDYAEHEKTYRVFGSLIKWGSVGSLVFVLFVGGFTGVLPWFFVLLSSVLLAILALYA